MSSEKSKSFGAGQEGGSLDEGIVRFVCPICFNSFVITSEKLEDTNLKCEYCGKLVNRKVKNTLKPKCLNCLLSMKITDGIWCLKYKGRVDENMISQCREFVNKNIKGYKKVGTNER